MKQNNKFKMYASCVSVKGNQRSVVCDLQRQHFTLIPNSLFDIIEEFDGSTIIHIKQHYNNEFDEIIDEYFIKKIYYCMRGIKKTHKSFRSGSSIF